MNETTITVAGNLVSDVTLRTTSRGDAMATFRIASSASRFDRTTGRWVDQDPTYWNVVAWKRAAENAAQSLAKGHPVVVHGRVRQRAGERDVAQAPGVRVPVTYTDIDAVGFGLDLSRCRATFVRAPIGPQTAAEPRSQGGAGEGPISPWASGTDAFASPDALSGPAPTPAPAPSGAGELSRPGELPGGDASAAA